jgi:hypothetical protein
MKLRVSFVALCETLFIYTLMGALNFPAYDFQIREGEKSTEIFDEVRKKWLVKTPEEWVRQHCVMYLHHQLGYPFSLMEIEKGLSVAKLSKRADIVISNTSGQPIMIVECKAPEIRLDQKVMDQAGRYNSTLKVPYLLITNGLKHFCCRNNESKWTFLPSIPHWKEL